MGRFSRTKRRTESEADFSTGSSLPARISCRTSKFFLQQLVELRGVRLAGGGLHHLSYEESEQLVLARAVVGELAGILRHDLVDRLLDGARVGDLLETLGLDDGVRVLALGPHRLEHVLVDLAGDG